MIEARDNPSARSLAVPTILLAGGLNVPDESAAAAGAGRPMSDGPAMPQTAVALAAEEARHRALFGAIRIPIVTASIEGRVTGFNAAAIALFGSPARLYGRQIVDVLPFVASPADPNMSDVQGQVADATGRTVDLEVSRTLMYAGTEEGYAVYVVHDISRHAEVNRLREQLLYSVAHELRGPLMVLDNALEIIDDEYATMTADDFATLVATARRTSRRMRTLMEDLLSAGSIQSGHFVVAPRPTELDTILQGALDIVRPLVEGREQRIRLHVPRSNVQVLADRRYARQVLSNLLANASKYGPERSTIRVNTRRTNGMLRISVSDEGPGIPPEQRVGLFERFYRVRTGNDVPGVGLGLAIAKGIVDAHGGSIGIDSEVGAGTSVWFTLPLAGRKHADPAR
jgi:signal transduction histidine kinase